MVPFHPPFPTASSLPFQPVVGSQTSTLMSESAEGRNVAVTRQYSGRSFATPPPAGTMIAVVIAASGKASVARESQEAASAGAAPSTSPDTTPAKASSRRFVGMREVYGGPPAGAIPPGG